MKNPAQGERTLRTIRLDDEEISKLLGELDELDEDGLSAGRKCDRYRYRMKALVVHMQQPGSTTTMPYLVPTRNISETGLAFVHGGFVHDGTRCVAQLITTYGTWDNIPATVARCRYIKANIHEVAICFDRKIDPSIYCTDAVQTRVLLAEDDPATARLASFHLSQLNAVVDVAENGQQAVEKAMQNSYDMILMDIEMPVMNGIEAVKELRSKGYSGTIVAATGRTQPEDQEAFVAAGCDKYFPKPFTREQLNTLLQSLREEPLFSTFYNDPSMVEIVDAFVQELPAKIRAIEAALTKEDTKALESYVRTLKGEGTGYGFEIISETAARVEKALLGGTPLAEIKRDLQGLMKLCLQARSCIRIT